MTASMTGTIWFLIVGVLLIVMALGTTVLKRLPATTAMLYLAVGLALGPTGIALARLDPVGSAVLLERVTEVAVLISLFTAGLKLRAPLNDRRWTLPIRLATGSMVVTVLLVTLVGVWGLGLPLGAAVLLGAILAPTDPVLASDVQVESPDDRDRLRFSLTGEAGLNDGTAFPFVMLGLGLLGHHELGQYGVRWLLVDVLWAGAVGLGVGALLGTLVGRLVLHLRLKHQEAVGADDFVALGLVALAYGAALLVKGYGFLAVFAAGLALRSIERRASDLSGQAPVDVAAAAQYGKDEEIATAEDTAPAYMAQAALGFTEQLERMAEVTVVLLVGTMLSARYLAPEALWFIPLLFLIIRPVAVLVVAPQRRGPRIQRRMLCWFGIRGIGSVYYLAYAIAHGLEPALAARLTALTLTVVAASVVVHGVSVTPLMRRYSEKVKTAEA